MKTVLSFLLACALISARADGASTDFEDLTLQTLYAMGSTFTSQDLSFKVVQFTSGGSRVSVGQSGYSGGSGKELFMGSRVGLDFQLDAPAAEISFRYGEFCCGSGVTINGITMLAPNNRMVNLDGGTVGGVLIDVALTTTGNNKGTMTITGVINSFIVGGTEFAIDDVTVLSDLQPGDFDFDGDVDGQDFLAWQRGESPRPNTNADLIAWQEYYGLDREQSASPIAVPEPAMSALMASMLLAAVVRRTR